MQLVSCCHVGLGPGWQCWAPAASVLLQATFGAFKRRDLYLSPSQRWGDPREQLLSGVAWQAQRTSVCRTLGQDELPEPELARLKQELDAVYRRTGNNLPTNEAVQIERAHGRQELGLSWLDKPDVPPAPIALETLVAELLLEVPAWTGFASDFNHVNEHGARADHLAISVCAALLAEACNIGLAPLVRPDIPALTGARLAWIQQSYICPMTISQPTRRRSDSGVAHCWVRSRRAQPSTPARLNHARGHRVPGIHAHCEQRR